MYLADYKELEEYHQGFLEGTHRCFFVEEERTLLGFGWLMGDRLSEGYVFPSFRGRGLQKFLIEARSEAGGECAEVRESNFPSNRSFEKLGWTREAHPRPNYNIWRKPEQD